MKTIPQPNSIITHIKSGAKFSTLSINLGGDIKMRCINKGESKTFKLGKITSIDLSDLDKCFKLN
jgi:hypothetical protein